MNSANQDQSKYGFGWTQFNSTYLPPHGYQSIYRSFQFQDADSLDGLPFEGQVNTYDGNGFVYEMRGQLSYIQGNLSLLQDMNWVDRQTRAVFIEFSTYNPNINLVMVTTILIEFLSSGIILTSARFDPLNLFSESGQNIFSFKIVSEIMFMVFIVYFIFVELRKIIFKRDLKDYACEFWTWVEWSIIITALTAFIMFLFRFQRAQQVLDFFKRTSGYGYMKLQKANFYNQTLTFSLGLCVFLGTIKVLKILRFNSNISNFSSTFKVCFSELSSFSLVFFLIYISFVQLFYLMFGNYINGYSSFIKSMETAFLIMMGKFDANQYLTVSPVLGPLIFSIYNCVILLFALNIFISIIVEAFSKVRKDSKKKPNEFNFFNYGWKILMKKFSRKSKNEENVTYHQYRDHLSVLPKRVTALINYFIRVINNNKKHLNTKKIKNLRMF